MLNFCGRRSIINTISAGGDKRVGVARLPNATKQSLAENFIKTFVMGGNANGVV